MPLFIVWIIQGFKWLIGTVLIQGIIAGIIKIAVGLGLAQVIALLAIGTISYQGSAYTVDWVVTMLSNQISTLPLEQQQILFMVGSNLRADEILTVLFTAFLTVASLWTFKGAWRVFGFGE